MLEEIRRRIREQLAARSTHQSTLDSVISAAEARAEGERDLSADEQTRFDEARQALIAIDETLGQLDERETELADIEARRTAAAASEARFGTGPARVTSEARTYRADGGASFFADAYRSQQGDYRAQARINAHMRECEVDGQELRDAGTSNFGGLVVPQYLIEEFAAVLRNGRAFANACRRLPLPAEGMSMIVPRGETGSNADAQATQNSAVSETDVDFDDDLTVPVRTYAGQQDVARQALERGSAGIDRLVYADLVADYAEQLDADIIAHAGTGGKHKGVLSATGVNAITYTDATPTVAELWPKLADAIGQVATGRKMAANLIVMAPRRWAWLIAALDGQQRPLIVADPSAAVNAMGKQAAAAFGEGQLVGTIQGVPVLVDGNVPLILGAGTNEDRIAVVRREDSILWEENDGMPRELRFEQTTGGSLTTKLVVYGYSAFTAERYPKAKSVIAGTGLITPTF